MTSVAIIDDNIIRASSLLQAVNNVEGFSCTHIFCHENDLKQINIDIDIILYCLGDDEQVDKKLFYLINLRFEGAKLILYAGHLSSPQVMEGIKNGVCGFFSINSVADRLDAVLIAVRDHEVYLPPYILKSLLNSLSVGSANKTSILTRREAEICLLLKEGRTYEQIAEKCAISINTVRFFVKSVYKKYEVKSKIQLLNKLQQVAVL